MAHGSDPHELEDWYAADRWDLAARQLRAIEAFHHARAIAAWAAAARERSRRSREQDAQRLEVLRRTHEAVVRRAHEQLRASGVALAGPSRHLRVVLADPDPRDGCAPALDELGMVVVAHVDDGADAVGIVLVEQPDLVVVGGPLLAADSDEVVRDVRHYSPGTAVVALASTPERARACAAAGATVVLDARTPVPDLVEHLQALVSQRHPR